MAAIIRRPFAGRLRITVPAIFKTASYKNAAELTPPLRLRCHDSIYNALAEIGESDTISAAFTGFQKFL